MNSPETAVEGKSNHDTEGQVSKANGKAGQTPVATNNSWITHRIDQFNIDRLTDHEWLLTNGTGAYAMGTATAINTQRYHGLLVAATQPPVGRIMALNQVLERLSISSGSTSDQSIDWGTCVFQGDLGDQLFTPEGYKQLVQFEKGLSAAWTYRNGSIEMVRHLFLHWKQQAATIQYRLRGLEGQDATLHVQPMMTLRDFHGLLHRNHANPFACKKTDEHVTVTSGDHQVTLACNRGNFVGEKTWWSNLHYPVDSHRGQEDHEDCFVPGQFEIQLDGGIDEHEIMLTVGLGETPIPPEPHVKTRSSHLTKIFDQKNPDDTPPALLIAADDFVVDRTFNDRVQSTIMAGYPWFSDWGRDTFIALPGLLLATKRFNEAAATLSVFADAIRDGLVPNRFDDYNSRAAHYNTVDASLWFVYAAIEYVTQSQDRDAWNNWLRPAVTQVIEAYIKGTQFDIAMSGDGLITAGTSHTQLTWMDAACEDKVFTPRCGKAVEINALWHHTLLATAELIEDDDARTADHYKRLAGRTRRAFLKLFWNNSDEHLHDHVWVDLEGNEHVDTTFRPNQIFTAMLPYSPIPRTKQNKVVQAVGKRLLTPYGLRTLPTDDTNYHGSYSGPQPERDEAYHQGTVWPWLIGPYAEAVLRVGQFKPDSIAAAKSAIQPLIDFVNGEGLGQLHEIHEGDPPHRPVGCIAQAWSVAAILRVLQLIRDH